MSQLQLTDLDDHNCLVRVLVNLDIDDLLNVADTCQQMRAAAKIALRLKYSRDFTLELPQMLRDLVKPRHFTCDDTNNFGSADLRFIL